MPRRALVQALPKSPKRSRKGCGVSRPGWQLVEVHRKQRVEVWTTRRATSTNPSSGPPNAIACCERCGYVLVDNAYGNLTVISVCNKLYMRNAEDVPALMSLVPPHQRPAFTFSPEASSFYALPRALSAHAAARACASVKERMC